MSIKTFKVTIKPDDFQQQAIDSINLGSNVIVTAPTGTGKTLIATTAITDVLSREGFQDKIVVYTTPIKALSNEKYAQLNKQFNNVGLITGDNKFNIEANILVMTTEIYSRMLFESGLRDENNKCSRFIDPSNIALVIFDEAHYIFDQDRGHVWETSMKFSSIQTQLLLLSATISADQLSDWLRKVCPSRPCEVVTTTKRHVPLTHSTFQVARTKNSDIEFNKKMCPFAKSGEKFNHDIITKLTKSIRAERKKNKDVNILLGGIGLINYLIDTMKTFSEKYLPAIFFVLNKDRCEEYASLSKSVYTSPEAGKSAVLSIKALNFLVDQVDSPHLKESNHFKLLLKCVERGVGFHHSGMHPVLKEAVELMFGKGHIKVLFATETFAVGVNYPAKTVVLTTLYKYDSTCGNRLLLKHEYLQMAGRAGRRGFDSFGNVIVTDNRNFGEIPGILTSSLRHRTSMFKLTHTLVLRMLMYGNIESICHTYCTSLDKVDLIGLTDTATFNDMELVDEYKQLVRCKYSGNKEVKRINKLEKLKKNSGLMLYIHKENDIERLRQCYQESNDEIYAIIDHLINLGALVNNERLELTKYGLALLEFDEHLYLPVLLYILKNNTLDTMSDKQIIKILCMISEQGKDEYTTDMDDIVDELRKIYLYERKSFCFNDNVSTAISEWFDSDTTINDYDISSGIMLKSILKVKNLITELQSACIILDNMKMNDRLNNIHTLLLSTETMRDSLYLRSVELE